MPNGEERSGKRILFASYHGYIDPSSGAAICVRELLGPLASRGWEVRTFCGPLLDFDQGEDVRQVLADERIAFRETTRTAEGRPFSLLSFEDGAIRSSIFVPKDPSGDQPSPQDARSFLGGFQQAINQWRPDILLTYGGNRTAAPMFRLAQQRGIRVVFWLHNFAYANAGLFEDVDCVVVPSECSAAHYREKLALATQVVPCPLDRDRVVCDRSSSERYVTFVNPQPDKGVFVFARIAEQLHRRRPDIPLLVVEGRAGVEWLERTELDLSGLTNLNVMKNTPDARDFYSVSHIVLMPSLWQESFGRVAAEAMMNGIPVLASRRGALPEVLDDAGFLFDIPKGYTPESRSVPGPEEVAPWVEMILRLWDNPSFYEEASCRCRRRAEAWRAEMLIPQYERVFE